MKSIKIKPVQSVGCDGCIFDKVREEYPYNLMDTCVGADVMRRVYNVDCTDGIVFQRKGKQDANATR